MYNSVDVLICPFPIHLPLVTLNLLSTGITHGMELQVGMTQPAPSLEGAPSTTHQAQQRKYISC